MAKSTMVDQHLEVDFIVVRGEVPVDTGQERKGDVHSLLRNFKLGHDSTRVSARPRTATQTPISVSSASVDRGCDWTAASAVKSSGVGAASMKETKCALNIIRMKGVGIVAYTCGPDISKGVEKCLGYVYICIYSSCAAHLTVRLSVLRFWLKMEDDG